MSRLNIVTYARVSTKSQHDRGASLADQEARFVAWLAETGHVRQHAYREAMSAGTVERRKTFVEMIEQIEATPPEQRPYAVVIDRLDRFSRNKLEGVQEFMRLADLNVRLWSLAPRDESDDTPGPLDLNVEADCDWLWDEFNAAEREHRAGKRRQKRRYQGQRARGAATHNRAPFGLKLIGEVANRKLVIDEDKAPVVREVDRRILAGQSQRRVLAWVRTVDTSAWQSRRGLVTALLDDHDAYMKAGLRTPQDQAALRALSGTHRAAFGYDRVGGNAREHQLAGVVACAECVAAGIEPSKALMAGRYIVTNPSPFNIMCPGERGGRQIHAPWMTVAHKVSFAIALKLRALLESREAQAALLERLRAQPSKGGEKKLTSLRQLLEGRLANIDRSEGALDQSARGALALASSSDAGVASEATRLLSGVSHDRMALQAQREAVLAELAGLPLASTTTRDFTALERALQTAETFAEGLRINDDGTRLENAPDRELLRPFIDALGPPILERRSTEKWKPRLILRWPILDGATRV